MADEKFEAWMSTEERAISPASPSSLPITLYNAAAQQKGAAWVTSWIIPCRYDAVARVLHAKTDFAARTIATELGSLLRTLGIGLGSVATA